MTIAEEPLGEIRTDTLEIAVSGADAEQAIGRVRHLFARQKSAFARATPPTTAERQQHLAALAGMVMTNRRLIQEAMTADFSVHPEQFTDMTEVLAVAGHAMYVSAQLPNWTAPEERDLDRSFYGSGQAAIRYEPKGVMGIISPWNFPFLLSLGPLADMLGAGNRVIIKPSENAPACADLLHDLITRTFDPDHVAVVCGGLELARTFPTLQWDHLLYTGSTEIGREIAVACARNLVPVTLELGGKNPAIIHSDSVDAQTVAHIVGHKLAKSGQVCIAPDYCLVPRDRMPEFVHLARESMDNLPAYSRSADCAGIVSGRHLRRLIGLLDEAAARGCEIVRLGPDVDVDMHTRQMPVSLVLDPPNDIGLMREEIFGPVLPIVPYDTIDDAVEFVNTRDRPLGLYVFAKDPAVAGQVLDRTPSGGACVNACAIQGVLPSLGFGGAGSSGNGRHRGIEGFREFSNARGVFTRGDGDLLDAFFPPYSGLAQAAVSAAFGDA